MTTKEIEQIQQRIQYLIQRNERPECRLAERLSNIQEVERLQRKIQKANP